MECKNVAVSCGIVAEMNEKSLDKDVNKIFFVFLFEKEVLSFKLLIDDSVSCSAELPNSLHRSNGVVPSMPASPRNKKVL